MSTTELLTELKTHYIAVLDYSLGGQRSDVTKADAVSSEVDAVKSFIEYLETSGETPDDAPAPVAAAKPAKPVRCPWAREIRRCFAIASEHGLDTRNDEAMRKAFSAFLGHPVESREDLTGLDWLRCANRIKTGELSW
jgi:hypothetical protein